MDTDDDLEATPDEYEVSRLVDICYGDPSESGERGLKFKVSLFILPISYVNQWASFYNHKDYLL